MEQPAWTRNDGDAEAFETKYWLDPFPRATSIEDRMGAFACGPEARMSPIMAYDYRDCGWVQWVHPSTDTAVLMVADGGWRGGGTLHVWFSLGSDKEPFKYPFNAPDILRITDGNFRGWMDEMSKAARFVEEELSLRVA